MLLDTLKNILSFNHRYFLNSTLNLIGCYCYFLKSGLFYFSLSFKWRQLLWVYYYQNEFNINPCLKKKKYIYSPKILLN